MARRDRALVLLAIAVLTLLAWAWLARGTGMDGMGRPPFAAVILMWWVMMAAMMLPSATPAILLYGRNAARHPAMPPSWHFLSGYLLVWLAFSLVAAALQGAAVRALLLDPMSLRTGDRISAALWITAGLYQLTPLKTACLGQCRTPASFLARHYRAGRLAGVRLGILHGAFCVGCCWALMALLLVGGVMNLLWIAALAALIAIEKIAPHGERAAQATGAAMVAWGAVALLR